MTPTALKESALKRAKEPLRSIEPTYLLANCGLQHARGEIMSTLAMEQAQTVPTSVCSTTADIAALTDQLRAVAASLAQHEFDCSDGAAWIALDTALASVHVALVTLGDVTLQGTEAGTRTDRQ